MRASALPCAFLVIAAAPPPVFEDLGSWHHAVRASPQAQTWFDQGLRFMYAFNHEEAIKAFERAAEIDPQCAMCLWGAALALGPNINLPTDAEREKKAWDLVVRARALDPQGAEKDYVEAVARRYTNPPGPDRKAVDKAYADAMRELWRKYPDDVDGATLFAESMMDLRPWQLWTRDGKAEPGTEEILAALEKVLAVQPDHPGANHFYIHATEASPHPEKALAAAARLPGLMPGAGHIVHMPAHAYIRTGRYEDAAEANRRAIGVDKKYLMVTNAQGFYPMMYVAHNYQFLWGAAAIEGRSAEAIEAARDMAARFPDEMVRGMEKDMPGI
ncbi:MAG TPA: tetratricopeptide repeat protein, partial [Myxococcales bacterium]